MIAQFLPAHLMPRMWSDIGICCGECFTWECQMNWWSHTVLYKRNLSFWSAPDALDLSRPRQQSNVRHCHVCLDLLLEKFLLFHDRVPINLLELETVQTLTEGCKTVTCSDRFSSHSRHTVRLSGSCWGEVRKSRGNSPRNCYSCCRQNSRPAPPLTSHFYLGTTWLSDPVIFSPLVPDMA